MNILIAYTSRTGNTRKLAEAMHLALPDADLCPAASAPDPSAYDLVFAGFWVESEKPNEEIRKFFKRLKGKPVALFATLGAYPDTLHAANSMNAAIAAIPDGNVVDTFMCQGAIDPLMIEWMEKLPEEDANAPTESRRQLWKDAETHPDEADLKAVVDWAVHVLERQKAGV